MYVADPTPAQINSKSIINLLVLNVENDIGKYLCNDRLNANDNAPPAIT